MPAGEKKKDLSDKTKVVNDNLNPVWNEDKEFAINQPKDTEGKIRFEVFDSDMVGSFTGGAGDPFLGFVEVDWPFWDKDADGPFRAPVSLKLKAKSEKSKASGHLDCDIVWCPAGSSPRLADKEKIPIARAFKEAPDVAMRSAATHSACSTLWIYF